MAEQRKYTVSWVRRSLGPFDYKDLNQKREFRAASDEEAILRAKNFVGQTVDFFVLEEVRKIRWEKIKSVVRRVAKGAKKKSRPQKKAA